MDIFLIAGLGNIGHEYEQTRHNSGFMALSSLVHSHGLPPPTEKARFHAFVTEGEIKDRRVILAEPTTLMNLSGQAVRAISDFYKIPPQRVIIIHDEIDLEFGTVRSKSGGGSAGHRGVQSVIDAIGPDFHRVRIGIRNDKSDNMDTDDFVLGRFRPEELEQLSLLLAEAASKAVRFIA